MEAIILAGGFGTRLKEMVIDVPKPMADINGKPFLKYLFDWLLNNGIDHLILAVGYKADVIQDYFSENYQGIHLSYSFEVEPLGTGGAIKKAYDKVKNKNRPVFVINGDTFFNVNLKEFYDFHNKQNNPFSIVVKKMFDFERYGSVKTNDNFVEDFIEKRYCKQGFINGGIYLMNSVCMGMMPKDEKFSFEKTFLEKYVKSVSFGAFKSDGYFIDIGIPVDYTKAKIELPFKI
ncbi:NTP transferase domain-containing protein [Labilibaculum sp. A4]|uniref:nucleotidyltransferase family protein n=1 Tax=Labilibaculum euxinus TaxID=2686357 RepID=UPI000F617B58|nr:nucleotidyltransferase family protein [Labilibaculum euxinus]MDQ1772725.1 nucleotidyltransferase family protein [Labilibaculum euxinus]MWN78317.1 NTP transferase domain-containing protein [Labilibaculum euxinus]